ncbi:MAG: HAD family hydrolase [Calditrichaeota bacterium]|nr:HAD family hydrolase [Calditrichota bacterium]
MLKWIFFDVGNVILNDDPAMALLYRKIYETIQRERDDVSFSQILSQREALILNERDGKHFVSVALSHLGRKKWAKYELEIKKLLRDNWAEVSPLMPAIVPVIQNLVKKYNLGIIANQPTKVCDVLEAHGLLEFFKIHGVSETVGLRKPDPEFFRWALREANCRPEEAVMIGDRVDNDIAPAKTLGMRTIWLSLTVAVKNYLPQDELEKIYLESVKRASVSLLQPRDESETPDGIAKSFEEILEKVENLDNEQQM